MGSLTSDVIASHHDSISSGHGPRESLGLFVRQDLFGALRGVYVHRKKAHAVRVFGLDILQLPQRGTADRSPGGVEVEDQWTALETVQGNLLTLHCGQHEIRGLLSHLVAHLQRRLDRW